MSWSYRTLVRPVLFNFDSEDIHNRTLDLLGQLSRSRLGLDALESFFGMPQLPSTLWGLNFPNPVGLAAGMDKTARAIPAWAALGFGFCEVGGATWHPQPGNSRPRMFRAVDEEALINRMGFNNPGAPSIAAQLVAWRESGFWPNHPVGVNLGKSKVTPLDDAPDDYAQSFRAVRPTADFFVVNVSSPNTPNLRQLQDRTALDEILHAIQEQNLASSPAKPLLVKVAPDLSFAALDEILELAGPRQLSGIVATNTTISRPPASVPVFAESGGLSGRPLARRSTEVIRHLFRQTAGNLPIIGVGGIFSSTDAWEKITAGASLIQIYTGLVFEGPGIARHITEGLIQHLADHGLGTLHDAVGIAAGD
jgi:dihydroorotate dehydrogenase